MKLLAALRHRYHLAMGPWRRAAYQRRRKAHRAAYVAWQEERKAELPGSPTTVLHASPARIGGSDV